MFLPLTTLREINEAPTPTEHLTGHPRHAHAANVALRQLREIWADTFKPGWRAAPQLSPPFVPF